MFWHSWINYCLPCYLKLLFNAQKRFPISSSVNLLYFWKLPDVERMWDFGSLILYRSIPQIARKFKISCYTYGFWSFENVTMKRLENVRTHMFETLDFEILKLKNLQL